MTAVKITHFTLRKSNLASRTVNEVLDVVLFYIHVATPIGYPYPHLLVLRNFVSVTRRPCAKITLLRNVYFAR